CAIWFQQTTSSGIRWTGWELELIALFLFSIQAASPPSPSANEPKYEKRWLDAVCMPLLMARVSRYKAGTDKLRRKGVNANIYAET
ncbi:hypothetical protein ILYODFUR_021995, partial [Ilyodon furcidens]